MPQIDLTFSNQPCSVQVRKAPPTWKQKNRRAHLFFVSLFSLSLSALWALPGRFDRLLYLGVPDDRAQQLHIVKALTRKFNMSSSVRLEQVVQAAPLNLTGNSLSVPSAVSSPKESSSTGADFYALCSEALQAAIREQIISLSSLSATAGSCSSAVSLAKGPVLVEQHHFMEALTAITPSVSPTELEQYRQLQQTYAQSQSSHGRPGLLG